jgi:conjugal transfer pilus assembly protein TraK
MFLMLAPSPEAHALQVLEAAEGQTVLGRLSSKELTRIAVEGGRIRKVTGQGGEFLMEKDEDQGQIFIRPTSPENPRPINLFVTLEAGGEPMTVGLLLQPVDIPAETIMLRPSVSSGTPGARKNSIHGSGQAEASRPDPRSPRHVRQLKNLLVVMADNQETPDFEVREVRQEQPLWVGTRLVLQRQWLGDGLVGERYRLANIGPQTLRVHEQHLFKPGVMALSVEHDRLEPGQVTALFVIRQRRDHE